MTQPTVSKLVASLERHLGGKLFARSTRQLALTAEGERFYEQCRAIVDVVASAEASFKTGREEIAGVLHIASSVSFGRTQLMSRMYAFMRRYPFLRVDLQLNDRFVDIVEEGVDVAFRIGELKDSGLIARRIGTTHRVTVGTPDYFRRHGEPRHPADLKAHNCVLYTGLASMTTPRAIAVACDMPLLKPALLRLLLRLQSGHDAAVPLNNGLPEPLCAVYAATCLAAVKAQLDAAAYKMTGFFDSVDVRFVEPPEWQRHDPEGDSFLNLNQEEDLQQALQRLS